MHVVSVAYLAFAPDLPDPAPEPTTEPAPEPTAADPHATESGPAPITLAFDHARILADGLDRARAKIEYSPLATAFLQYDFTILRDPSRPASTSTSARPTASSGTPPPAG
ncbi:hypothetical protein MCM47_28665 [Kitasatospora sp. A2-31]|nr:hypothetical protein [Kitasatospora sp. A2-31]